MDGFFNKDLRCSKDGVGILAKDCTDASENQNLQCREDPCGLSSSALRAQSGPAAQPSKLI